MRLPEPFNLNVLPSSPRIIVIGTSGAGKTTLARDLAQRLGVPHVEMDALHWEAHWTPADPEVFRLRVQSAVAGNAWTMDGGYGVVRDLVWGRANLLIWLDYSLPLILVRLTRRTFRRVVTREELWNGNRESFMLWLFSRDSLLYYVLRTYRKRRKSHPPLFELPEYAHLNVLRFRSPKQTRAWMESLSSETLPSSP